MRVGDTLICKRSLFDNAGYNFVLLEEYEVIEINNESNDIVLIVDGLRYHFYINDNTYYDNGEKGGEILHCLNKYFWTPSDIRKKKLERISTKL